MPTRVEEKTCLRCGEKWLPRKGGRPITCPKCRSPYWDRPKEIEPHGN